MDLDDAITNGKIDAVQTDVTAIKGKTDNLPAAPAAQGDITAAHAVTDGKVDAVQADVSSIKGTVEALPTQADLEASEVLAKQAPMEAAIATAHGVTDAAVDLVATGVASVLVDTTAIKAATDNLPATPASQGDVTGAHAVTDGKVDAVQSDLTSIKGTVGALPTLAEIEASTTLAKEASVDALPTLAEIEASEVLAMDATVAKEATLTTIDGKVDAIQALLPSELVGLLFAVGGGPYALSDDVLFANDPAVSKDSADYVKAKEINVGYLSGCLRVAFDSRDPSGAEHWVHARVYKNGVALGTEHSQNGAWYTYSEELEFAKNDLLQLYVKNSDAGFPVEVRNFRILGKYPVPGVPAVVVVS